MVSQKNVPETPDQSASNFYFSGNAGIYEKIRRDSPWPNRNVFGFVYAKGIMFLIEKATLLLLLGKL